MGDVFVLSELCCCFLNKILNLNTLNWVKHSLIHLFPPWLSFAKDPNFSHITYIPASECICVQVLKRNIEYVFSAIHTVSPYTLWHSLPHLLEFSGLHASLETSISQVVMGKNRHFKPDRPKHPTSTTCFIVVWSWAWYSDSIDLSFFLVSPL